MTPDGYKRSENGLGLGRDANGRVLPGNHLGRRGRPKGAIGFARRIRLETRGGLELIEAALVIARTPSHKDCLRAVEFLTERMRGQPRDAAELEQSEEQGCAGFALTIEEAKRLLEGKD